MDIPKRRGRPPATQEGSEPINATTAAISESSDKPVKRRRRESIGGMKMRLQAEARPGYHRRWFNDSEGRLAEAGRLAYEHVKDNSAKSDGIDSNVRYPVGTKANGQPLYAYLMETPIEEYAAGQEEREELHSAVDKAIMDGRDATGRVQNAYGEGSIGEGRGM